ncbi:related to YSC84 - protein involved in the organization of the actin cytoskeleton [Melanopsichium pennsylvanicum]|uniref:Related to YSC84 - protein involved in the organization of the actin cytoskeleton n=2 Tax=Melanopsichium pennsylvanicum TaxID=63383 RepID=A0AAJ4XHN6_9BASI|nr:related to YSC84-protein involved in the organization of the actin cytoskeleton [Melanopsichium pennsylvanicum 4]SNX82492.1 related to YSC84 - protein involved in the organization of the actin cytoskeleton [Melanopsichium pennsylvanicum]
MSLMDKFRNAAQKASIQANAFAQQASKTVNQQAATARAGFSLPKECDRAAKILQAFLADPEHPDSALNSIPKAVLQNAKGLAVFSVIKAGFVWSGKIGSGVVIARLPDGSWSAPSCIGTGAVGFGLQIGADLTEFVIVMNSEEAVKAFAHAGNLTIGGSLSAAAGPIGTGGAINAAIRDPAPLFTYSRSKGLFAGISLEGTVLVERKETNKDFYGQPIPAVDLLTGKVPAPEAASAMYEVVEAAELVDESGIPQQSYVPQADAAHASVQGYDLADDHQAGAAGSVAPAASTAINEASKPIFDA